VSLPGQDNKQQQHKAIVSEIISRVQGSSSSEFQTLPLEVVLVDQAWKGVKEQDILGKLAGTKSSK